MKQWRQESGQAMVEFALTAVLFFTLFLFVLDGSRIMWNYVTVSEAARNGARYATMHGSKSLPPELRMGPASGSYTALTNAVLNSTVGLTPANLTVTATWASNNNPGSSVTVLVSYRVSPVTSMFWPGQTLTLTAQSTMVIQN